MLRRDRGRALAGAADDDRRGAAGYEPAGAAEDREQDGRAEAREEVAVDLAADAGLAGRSAAGEASAIETPSGRTSRVHMR